MLGWLTAKKRDPHQALKESLGDYRLPTFPKVGQDVLRLLRQPDIPPATIGDRLGEDPGLSAKVLRVANSSAFALRRPVAHIDHAIVLLGRSTVESLVLAAVAERVVSNHVPASMDMKSFWKAAAKRASTARALADLLHPATRAQTFTASLLSDMAVPLLGHAYPERYAQVFDHWRREGGELAELEREALSVDHATVAGWAAQAWSFPTMISDAIGAHHEDDFDVDIPAVLLAADFGEADPDAVERTVELVHERWGIGTDRVRAAIEDGLSGGDHMAGRMG